MRLLIIGSDYVWSIERYYLKYIQEINPETILFPAQNRQLDYLNQSIFNKVKHRLGISSIYQKINSELWYLIEEFKPDWIWVFKGMQVLPATLLNAKLKGIKLANYNPDNPFIFTGRGSGNQFVSKSIRLYDLYFTYNLEIKKQLVTLTQKRVEFLPFGFDLPNETLEDIMKESEIVKPCFLGNPDEDRADFVTELNRNGIHLNLFGNEWAKFVSSEENIIHNAVYGIEFYKILRRYRIQLNMMRVHNLQSHNMRTFEIPAVGGIQLAPDTPEHRMFFEEGKEIFLYQDTASCAKRINELLTISSEEAKMIRESAFLKSKNSGYSYQQRSSFVFNILNSL